jgi:hypothetical protein
MRPAIAWGFFVGLLPSSRGFLVFFLCAPPGNEGKGLRSRSSQG